VKVEEKVALCAIKHHPESHIQIDLDKCANCQIQPCLGACPAGLYTLEPETNRVIVDHTGCLECGTCLLVCPLGAIDWRLPEPGFGIRYRYG